MESNQQTPHDNAAFTPKELLTGVGATLLLFFSVLLFPVIGLFVSVLSPLPTMIAAYRWPRALALRVPFGTLAVAGAVTLVLGTAGSLIYLAELLLLGFLMGESARRGAAPEFIVGRACAAVFFLGAIVFWYTHGGGGGVFEGIEQDLRANMRALTELYPGVGGDEAAVEEISRSVIPLLARLLPGGALASLILMAWFNLHMLRQYCRLNKLACPGPEDLSRWAAPPPLVWVVVAGLVLILTPGTARIAGLNILIVASTVYLLQGLAVVGFYCNRWRAPGFIRAFAYMLIFLQQFLTLGVVLLGLFDLWFDFRRLTKPDLPGEES